jgi:nitrite reductase/ring-hydroxylating ferredoxin subunit
MAVVERVANGRPAEMLDTKPNDAGLIALCAAVEVKPDAPVQVVRGEMTYAVFNLDGEYYVTQDLCTHGPGSLSEGFIMDGEVECPFHQGRFDIRTGRATAAPCTEAVKTWAVHVVDGQICINPISARSAGA